MTFNFLNFPFLIIFLSDFGANFPKIQHMPGFQICTIAANPNMCLLNHGAKAPNRRFFIDFNLIYFSNVRPGFHLNDNFKGIIVITPSLHIILLYFFISLVFLFCGEAELL